MRNLPCPTDEKDQPLDAGNVFETCVSMVKNPELRKNLLALRAKVEAEAADYSLKAKAKQLYHKQPHIGIGNITAEDLVKIYTLRMVPKTSKGRPIYDRIMSASPHNRCPLCGIGTVNTLDHFLPKMQFPIFSVAPNNLVPACTWCQGEKLEYYPTTEGEQLLHPYFDNIDSEVWLAAEVMVGTPAAFRYFASPPDQWSLPAKSRVQEHLRRLNLPLLFSSNAGSRLSEIRSRLEKLHQKGGANAVRAHLNEELSSIEEEHKNSWTAAMYRAAVASDWFCNGGFLGK